MAKSKRDTPFYEVAAEELQATTGDALRRRLGRLSPEELLSYVEGLLEGLDEEVRMPFVRRLPPLHPEWREGRVPYASDEEFLAEVSDFTERVANEEYVDRVEYDPVERNHRGFGDDSWIEQMDVLFDVAAGYFTAGHCETATRAYKALFDCLRLPSDGGWFFTTTWPYKAIRTDIGQAKQRYFAALWRLRPDETTAERIVDEVWEYHYFDQGDPDLTRLFPEGGDILRSVEKVLVERSVRRRGRPLPEVLDPTPKLLRQIYTHFRTPEERERFAAEHGAQHPWIYEDLARTACEKGEWSKAFHWAGEALAREGGLHVDRAAVADYRARAAQELGDRDAALTALWEAFEDEPTEARARALREEARAQGKWDSLYIRAIDRLMPRAEGSGWAERREPIQVLIGLMLAEGDLERAVMLASRPGLAHPWDKEQDPRLLVVGFLLRSIARGKGPESFAGHAPEIARRLGQPLDILRWAPADAFAGELPSDDRDRRTDWMVQLLLARIGQVAESGNDYEGAARDAVLAQELYRLQGKPERAQALPGELHAQYSRKQNLRRALRQAGLQPPEKPGAKSRR